MNAARKILAIVIAAALVAVAVWAWKVRLSAISQAGPAQESSAAKLARWRDTAAPAMLARATNDLTGFNRLIDSHLDTAGDNPKSWTGDVTAEFINQAGGVDRTNLHYKFSALDGSRLDVSLSQAAWQP